MALRCCNNRQPCPNPDTPIANLTSENPDVDLYIGPNYGWNWWSNNTDYAAVSPTLVKYGNGNMDLIAVGKDGRLWHNWGGPTGGWIGWNWWSDPIFAS